MKRQVWYCKIGAKNVSVPYCGDAPMRQAVEDAFKSLTGKSHDFLFSGWEAKLTKSEEDCLKKWK